ncbi:type III secretion system YopJ family effector HopZ1b [Pseudomonas savastanoi pv. phaseolicola]|uniref:type III secretion system YopJ family effector HopZ1b n=1 Tax=Pseudomonas savastanoi TaxID=29438 RepID=UPI000E30D8CD|nr:type III secretion system YopJ family effector HopZ1b [Pseudomonas savastanoi]MDG6382526.1 type III secretion system YopJ family effector HopZ1b [Pseudomonas savastanoi pv. phaseolicola]
MGNICIGGPRMSQQVYSPERADTPQRNALREQTEADIEQNSESMRLQQKIDDLKPYVSHATGPMKAYGQAAMDRASGKKTDVSFAQLDAEHLDAMVDVENQRNPDLNLRYFKHHKEFIQALESDGPSSFRAIYPLTQPRTGQAAKHHVMADVRLTPCEPPSIVITESGVIVGKRNKQLHRHNQTLEDLSESGVQLSQVAIIETQAQKTPDDCVMYCLNYAIKAHKNADQFDDIHHGLQRGTLLTESMEGESRTRTTAGTFEEETRYPVVEGDTHVAFGADVLPVDFYKHGASLTQALRLMERPDGRMAGRVNSKGHERAENLVERNQAFRISRRELLDEDNPQISQFSASIDGFRLQEIERVLAAAQR